MGWEGGGVYSVTAECSSLLHHCVEHHNNVQIKKAFNSYELHRGALMKEKHSPAPLGTRSQDGSPIRLTAAHVHANVTLCEHWSLPHPPTSTTAAADPPKNKQQLHILFKSGATGHPYEPSIGERAFSSCPA